MMDWRERYEDIICSHTSFAYLLLAISITLSVFLVASFVVSDLSKETVVIVILDAVLLLIAIGISLAILLFCRWRASI